VHSEAAVIANNLERWSFTTGKRYDERSAIKDLLTKLVDGGRYSKYHPNMMLSMFDSMSSAHPSGAAPSAGVEESKFDDADEPSAKELLDYRLRFPNRQPFLADAPKINSSLHHALHDAALNEALDSSRIDSSLSLLDAERERTLIYCSQLAEAKDRSLRDDAANVKQVLEQGSYKDLAQVDDGENNIPTSAPLTSKNVSSSDVAAVPGAGWTRQMPGHFRFCRQECGRLAAPATFWCCYGCRCYGVHDNTCRGSDTVITPPPAPAPAPVPPPDDDTFIDDDEDDEDETDTTAAPKQAHGNQRRSVFPFKRGAHPPVLRPPGHVVHLHASDVSPGERLFVPA